MTAHVIALRPRPRSVPAVRPVRSSSSPAVPPVSVKRDDVRDLHFAHCERCADSFTSPRLDEVDDWADSHRCDPEMAVLLVEIARGMAA